MPVAKDVGDPHAPRGGLPVRGAHRFAVMALDRKTGKVVWEQTAREAEPHEAAHNDNGTWASSSALTDGEHIIAPFESQGIYAYDMNGKLVWQKDLGDKFMRNTFGEGSTPALHKDRLFYVWDHQKGVVHRGAQQAHGRGAVAGSARRDRHLGHPARRRAGIDDARDRARHEPGAQLRRRRRQGALGRRPA